MRPWSTETLGSAQSARRSAPSLIDCVERLRSWEPSIGAWEHVADEFSGASVKFAQKQFSSSGPLGGVPFAVKDIIDVRGQPTRCGSKAFAEASAAVEDAPVVAALRRAGAVPIGKTRTTEFAFVDPTVTRNPYDPQRSPGGSSSGSGAVVGAGIVPFALGTQTAGSLCRPATYCGAASYKPGLGILPTTGVAPLSRSFDAVGVIAASAAWIAPVFDVLAGSFGIPRPAAQTNPRRGLRIGFVGVPEQAPEPPNVAIMHTAIDGIRAVGHRVDALPAPIGFADIIAYHRTIMLAEAARDLLPLVGVGRDLLQPLLAAGLAEGEKISLARYQDSLCWMTEARAKFWHAARDFDLLLSYPVPGSAPVGLSTTGDQSYLTPWTAMGGPLISLPLGHDPEDMPLGILLAAPPGSDASLVDAAVALAAVLPRCHPPTMPTMAG